MPAQGRGPRAGGGAQRPEPPSEVRSPRPRLVERAGGRANPRGRYRKGGRLKITLSGWEARARSLASFGARGLQGRWRWGGQRGIPPPPRGGVPACAPRLHVCGAARPGPLHPAGGRPLPRPGRSWQRPPPAAPRGWREALHYSLFTSVNRFEARRVGGKGAVGTAALGEGVGREGAGRRRGCGAGRGLEVPASAPAFRAHLHPPPASGRVRRLRRAPAAKCGPLIVPLGLCPPRPRPFRAVGRGLRAVSPALRAPRGRRRVPDAARASFIIIFGQVECARNSCFTRLTSEGGYSGNQGDE